MSPKFRHYSLLFLLVAHHLSFGQGQGRSPYSAIGFGEVNNETTTVQDMMGGTGVSFGNTFYINGLNPALVGKDRIVNGMKYVAFNVGGSGYFRNLEQNGTLGQDFGLNLSNLSMAFPIVRRWTVGINFKPYSVADNENFIRKSFSGSSAVSSYDFADYGGLSKAGLTNSFHLAKGLYAGVEAQYYFGNVVRDTTSLFITSTQQYNRYTGRSNLKGASLKGGIAYQQKLTKKWKGNIGATYQLGNNLKGEYLNIHQILVEGSNGITPTGLPDTLALQNFSASIPAAYRVGVSLEKTYKWIFAAEYGFTDWEGISRPFDARAAQTLRNSKEMNFGVEWIPNVNSSAYFNQVFYRAGFKSVTTPYYLNGIQIKDNSVSFGMSMPLGKGGSYLDWALAIGNRGTLANNLVKENYARISVSFSLMRDWFYRPRIQ
ncbi:hypothetical protein [Leadbetterella sp. DM7]|uniref:hypothetical protein n=1 Tax=Leadbetterella sp. DM7 TaxID=3235085 RepID=UPI00349E7258